MRGQIRSRLRVIPRTDGSWGWAMHAALLLASQPGPEHALHESSLGMYPACARRTSAYPRNGGCGFRRRGRPPLLHRPGTGILRALGRAQDEVNDLTAAP